MLMLVSWYFLPQHFNTAFIPLILTLWIRSASVVLTGYFRKREEKGRLKNQVK